MALFTGLAAAFAAISSWTISLGALGSFAIGNFLLRAAVQLGVSALAKAFAKSPGSSAEPFAIQGSVRTGGSVPRSFVVGPSLSAGSLVWHSEWGSVGHTPNAYYTQVIALSDLPVAGLHRWFIEGRAVSLEDTGDEKGLAAVEYREGGKDYAWIKFHDGTQEAADTFLTGTVNSGAPRDYSPSRIGKGIAYAIVTFRLNNEIFTGFPRSKFVLNGVKLYDISKDETQGGVGDQRWEDPATWGGDGDELPAVQAYNLARGFSYDGQWFYGLQGLTAARLPAAHWISQIAKCRAQVEGENGLEPIYRCAGEITVNSEIGSAFEAILTACAGRMSEVGGVFKIYVGAPDAPVAHFTDEDIVSLAPQSFTPFFGLSDTVNGVIASYPSPDEGYVMRSTPPLYNAAFEAEDGGRRLMTDVQLSFVPYPAQAQRLLSGELSAARRARRHTHTLPAKFRLIEPGDTVTWGSVRNGYSAKQFRVDGVIDLPNCDLIVDITEVDPSDHGGWDHGADFVPVTPSPLLPVRPTAQGVVGFDPLAVDIQDMAGVARRCGLLMQWHPDVDDVAGILFEIRLKTTQVVVSSPQTQLFEAGDFLVEAGLLPATEYEVRAKYIPASPRQVSWTSWVSVTTNDVRFGPGDFGPGAIEWSALALEVRDQVDSAGDANVSAQAAELARQASEAAQGGAVAAQGLAVDASAAAIAATVATLPSRLSAPIEAWTYQSTAVGAFPRPAISALRLITGDADFGACYESTAANASLGPAQALPFDPSRAFLVRVRVKTFDDGAYGGSRVMVGFSTYNSGGIAVQQANQQVDLAFPLSVADGVQEYSVLIHPAGLGVADLGTFSDFTHRVVHGSASDASDLITFHVRHNAGNSTNGKVRIGLIEVKDVTDVLAANISASASYDAEQAALSYRNDSETFAGAASSAKIASEAARDAASGSASSAAGSASTATSRATDAGNYANAANQSKLEAAASQDGALLDAMRSLPSTFEQDDRYFTSSAGGAPGEHPLSGWSFKNVTGEGRVAYRIFDGSVKWIMTSGVISIIAGRTYRLTVRARKVTSAGAPNLLMFFRAMDDSYVYVGLPKNTTVNLTNSMADYVIEYTPSVDGGFMRGGLYTRPETTSGEIRIQSILIEDVTEVNAAEAHSVAAGVSETAAVTAASEAQDAAAGAVFARDVAARVMGGGAISGDESIFLNGVQQGGVNKWTHSNGNTTTVDGSKLSGGAYGGYWEYSTGASPAGKPFLYRNMTKYDDIPDASKARYIEVEMDLEMVSGTWGSARIVIQWYGDANYSDTAYIADQLASQNGKIQQLKLVFERPENFSSGSELNDIRFVYYGSDNSADDNDHTARIHRVQCRTVSKAANALIQQKAVVDLQGNAEASLVFRAKAGGATGAVEIVAASNAAGAAASKVSLTGDEIGFNGLSVFDGALQSGNFSSGAAGWLIDESGNAEFNNLVVRDWVQVGAVSDGATFVDDVARTKGNDTYVGNVSLGAFELGQFWQIAVRFRCRTRGKRTYSTGPNKDGEPTSATDWYTTRVIFQMREKSGGVWGAWKSEYDTLYTPSNTTWQDHEYIASKQGVFENVQLRLRVYLSAASGWVTSYTNIDDVSIVARALVR